MSSYVTTFCNFAHNLKTGRPIGHECHILPPAALKAERDGNTALAIEILQARGKGPVVKGRAAKPALPSPVKTEGRTCFGLAWFTTEDDARAYATVVRKRGDTYNGGYFDGMSCGRDSGFDYYDQNMGRWLYAVTTR